MRILKHVFSEALIILILFFLLACSQQERAQAYIWLFALGGWSLEKRNPASVLFNMRWINDLVVGLSAAVLGPRNFWPE